MNDLQLMALVRSELLNALFSEYPISRTRTLLAQQLREVFADRPAEWLNDAVSEQLTVLRNAGLIRPLSGGYILTERGRADRLAAKQLMRNKLNAKRNQAGEV